jgi:nucleoid-associated protein YgaU
LRIEVHRSEATMSTFVIGGKRYRVKSKARFMTFITALIVAAVIISGFALSGGVSGTEKQTYKTVTIKSGDTLWSIAQEYKPADISIRQYIAEITEINDISPGEIYPGQIISITQSNGY